MTDKGGRGGDMAFDPQRSRSGRRQSAWLSIGAGIVLFGLLVVGLVLMWVQPGALGVTLAWVALFGLPVWVASWVMGADHLPEWYQPEHRVLLTDVDDLLGRDLRRQTEVVSRLPNGTLISLSQRRTGEVVLYALGREHTLTPLLLTQIRAASRPAEPREVEELDEAVSREEMDQAVREAARRRQPLSMDDR
jgi:hypothetical protein